MSVESFGSLRQFEDFYGTQDLPQIEMAGIGTQVQGLLSLVAEQGDRLGTEVMGQIDDRISDILGPLSSAYLNQLAAGELNVRFGEVDAEQYKDEVQREAGQDTGFRFIDAMMAKLELLSNQFVAGRQFEALLQQVEYELEEVFRGLELQIMTQLALEAEALQEQQDQMILDQQALNELAVTGQEAGAVQTVFTASVEDGREEVIEEQVDHGQVFGFFAQAFRGLVEAPRRLGAELQRFEISPATSAAAA